MEGDSGHFGFFAGKTVSQSFTRNLSVSGSASRTYQMRPSPIRTPSSSNSSMAARVDDGKYGQALTSRVRSGSRAGFADEGGGASSSCWTDDVELTESESRLPSRTSLHKRSAQFVLFAADMLERDVFEGLGQIGRLLIEHQ